MDTNAATCPVCGGSEYYKECGFYFCSECQTQSQEIREHAHEFYSTTKERTKVKKSPNVEKNKSGDTNDWTSWEYYNFILKGLVDELIGLGAQKRVKIVVLQLWATYLKRLDVAFTSKKYSRLPKLGINYHPRDAKLIYGCDVEERKRRIRRAYKKAMLDRTKTTVPLISSVTDESPSRLNFHKSKRALFKGEYEKNAKSSKHAMSDFDESMWSLATSSKGLEQSEDETYPTYTRLSFSSEAHKFHCHLRKRQRSYLDPPLMSRNKNTCKILDTSKPCILSRAKLLAILFIALQILQDDIQLSDILRWVEEGELSFYEVTHFLPDDVKLVGHDHVTFGPATNRPSYSGLCKTAYDLAMYLPVTHLPVPNLLSLAKRYIEELQLPAEIVKYVECIMALSSSSMRPKKSPFAHTLNYEGHTMAYIILVLKLLFGLDGKTEYEICRVTKKLNEVLESSARPARLFVWEEWVHYIECRRSVFGRFNFPTQVAEHKDAFNNPGSFMKFWERMKSKDDKGHARALRSSLARVNSELVNAVKRALLKLVEEETDDDTVIDNVPSLTPQKTNLEAIFASQLMDLQCSATGIPSPADILKQDFTRTTLEHLIKPEQYVAMANTKGIKIVLQRRSAQNDVEQVNKRKKTYQSRVNKRYIIVDTMKGVQHSRQGEKQMRKLSATRHKKHRVLGHDTHCPPDRELSQSRIFYHVPVIAEKILVKHLRRNGLHTEVDNLLPHKSDGTDDSSAESSSSSSDSVSSSSIATECDVLFQPSETFTNLPAVAEDMLARHLEKKDISSKVEDQLFQFSREVDLPIAVRRKLFWYKKKHDITENVQGNNEFVLHLPFVEYWCNEVNSKFQTVEEFEREVIVKFPHSFRWLITECARMLQMTIQELYYELLDVEDACICL